MSTHGYYAELQDLLPGIINQLGPDNLSHLKKIAEQVRASLKAHPITSPLAQLPHMQMLSIICYEQLQ